MHSSKNGELDGVRDYIGTLNDIKPDALIISDPGVFRIAREVAPDIPVHISTQANVTNISAVDFWHSLGAERVILAREVTGEETEYICKNSKCEVEVFCTRSYVYIHVRQVSYQQLYDRARRKCRGLCSELPMELCTCGADQRGAVFPCGRR